MTAERKIINPERIYLQGEESNPAWPDRTWCIDRIGDDDTEYVRVDLLTRRDDVIKALVEVAEHARRDWSYFVSIEDATEGVSEDRQCLDRATAVLALAKNLEEG